MMNITKKIFLWAIAILIPLVWNLLTVSVMEDPTQHLR